jgi:hypothetical protein
MPKAKAAGRRTNYLNDTRQLRVQGLTAHCRIRPTDMRG